MNAGKLWQRLIAFFDPIALAERFLVPLVTPSPRELARMEREKRRLERYKKELPISPERAGEIAHEAVKGQSWYEGEVAFLRRMIHEMKEKEGLPSDEGNEDVVQVSVSRRHESAYQVTISFSAFGGEHYYHIDGYTGEITKHWVNPR